MKHFFLSIWLSVIYLSTAFCQNFSPDFNLSDTAQIHVLETKRGDRFIGKVLKIEQTNLTFQFREAQELVFTFSEIEEVSVYNSLAKSAAFQPSYLGVFPTGYNYSRGEWEYQNVDLLWNTLNYGITDNFSVGGGFFLPLAFLAKLRWTQNISEKALLGVNIQSIIPLIEDANPVSILTLSGTIGEPCRLLNFGLGYGFDWASGGDPFYVFSLGGNVRLSSRVGMSAELDLGSFANDDDVLFFPSMSMHYFGKKNRLSLGFVADPAIDFLGLLGLPLLGYNQRF